MRSAVTLPKAHLHLHLEGSARPATMLELAAQAGLSDVRFGDASDWATFSIEIAQGFMAIDSLNDLARVCREVVEDQAAQGCLYAEPVIAPLLQGHLGSSEEVFACIREACRLAGEANSVEVRFQVAAIRDLPVEMAEDAARFAASHAGDGVVAFGLAGSEAPFPPDAFERAFAIAREAGLLSVPHAGELAGPASVAAAVDLLGANRIAHGVRSAEDPDLLRRLAAEAITCDVCPTSNVRLGVVGNVAAHPLPRLLEAGVPITINADDSLHFGPGIGEEYELARRTFRLTDDQLAAIARTSAEVSGASAETKARLQGGIDAWLTGTGN